jgi:hypothetical protein
MTPDSKDYNTSREKLKISEYGRNVQKLVEFSLTIEDREKRTQMAYMIVNIMSQLQPTDKPNDEYYEKLWNHLYIISDYKLDVDYPYEVLNKEVHTKRPEKVPYKDNRINFRFYGRNLESLLRSLGEEEDENKITKAIQIANLMKYMFIDWNKEIVGDEVILGHVEKITEGKVVIPEGTELIPSNTVLKMIKDHEKFNDQQGKSQAKSAKKVARKKPVQKGKPKKFVKKRR